MVVDMFLRSIPYLARYVISFHVNVAINHIQHGLSLFPFNGSETGISTDETFEITNLRIDVT